MQDPLYTVKVTGWRNTQQNAIIDEFRLSNIRSYTASTDLVLKINCKDDVDIPVTIAAAKFPNIVITVSRYDDEDEIQLVGTNQGEQFSLYKFLGTVLEW